MISEKMNYNDFAIYLFSSLKSLPELTRDYDKDIIELRGLQKRDNGTIYKNDTSAELTYE